MSLIMEMLVSALEGYGGYMDVFPQTEALAARQGGAARLPFGTLTSGYHLRQLPAARACGGPSPSDQEYPGLPTITEVTE